METGSNYLKLIDEKISGKEIAGVEAKGEREESQLIQEEELIESAENLQAIDEEEKTKTLQPETPWEQIPVKRSNRFDKPKEEELEEPEIESPDFTDVISAAFQSENLVVSTINDMTYNLRTPDYIDLNFDVYDSIKGTKYEDYFEGLADVNNAEALEIMKQKIDNQIANKEVTDNAGWLGTVSMLGAGIFDIDMLAGVGIISKGAKGISIARSAVKGAAITGATTGLTEVGLHATQETRTAEESIMAVGFGTVLGGVFGSAGAKYMKKHTGKSMDTFADEFDASYHAKDEDIPMTPEDLLIQEMARKKEHEAQSAIPWEDADRSIGAGQTPTVKTPTEAGGLYFKNTRDAKVVELTKRISPSLDASYSNFKSVREANVLLNYIPNDLIENVESNIASKSSVEATRNRWTRGEFPMAAQHENALFLEYKKNLGKGNVFGDIKRGVKSKFISKEIKDFAKIKPEKELPTNVLEDVKGHVEKAQRITSMLDRYGDKIIQEGNMSRIQFSEQVGIAQKNNDVHPNPHIEKAAKSWRAKIADPLKEVAIKTGQLDADVTPVGAPSHFPRDWLNKKIGLKEAQFKEEVLNPHVEKLLSAEKENFHTETHEKLNELFQEKDALIDEQLRSESEIRTSLKKDLNADLQNASVVYNELSKSGDIDLEKTPEGITPKNILDSLKQAREITKQKKPQSLMSFIVKSGGIKETDAVRGELKSRDITNKTRIGIVSDVGSNLDDMALKAQEAGFFPDRDLNAGDRITIQDLLDGMDEELSGSPVYRAEDSDYLVYQEALGEIEKQLDDIGLNLTDYSAGNIKKLEKAIEKYGNDPIIGKKIFLDSVSNIKKSLDDAYNPRIKALDEKAKKYQEERELLFDDTFVNIKNYTGNKIGEEAYVENIVNDLHSRMAGTKGTPGRFVEMAETGPLAKKTLQIEDALVDGSYGSEVWVNNNSVEVWGKYTRAMATDTALMDNFGTTVVADVIAKMDAEQKAYNHKNRTILSEKELEKSNKDFKRHKENFVSLWDIQRGQNHSADHSSVIVQIGRGIRIHNDLKALGGIVKSSVGDVTNPFKFHFAETFKYGMLPLLKKGGIETFQRAMKENKYVGLGNNLMTSNRTLAFLDFLNDESRSGVLGKALELAHAKAFVVSGFDMWNDFVQGWAGIICQGAIQDGLKARGIETAFFKSIDDIASGKLEGLKSDMMKKSGLTPDEIKQIATKDAYQVEPHLNQKFNESDLTMDEVKIIADAQDGNYSPEIKEKLEASKLALDEIQTLAGADKYKIDKKLSRKLEKAITKAGGNSKKNNAWLNRIGIGTRAGDIKGTENIGDRILKMIETHGIDVTDGEGGSLRVANSEHWTDGEAKEVYRTALLQDVDQVILTPGASTTPLASHHEFGKMFFQYKNFLVSSHQSMAVAALQHGEGEYMKHLLINSIGGMMVYMLKADELSDDPVKWLIEGADNSAMASLPFEANNIFEKITGYGIYQAAGVKESRRFKNRNFLGSVSPTLGTVNSWAEIAGAFSRGDITKSDFHKIRREWWLQNNIALKPAFDKLEEAVGDRL